MMDGVTAYGSETWGGVMGVGDLFMLGLDDAFHGARP